MSWTFTTKPRLGDYLLSVHCHTTNLVSFGSCFNVILCQNTGRIHSAYSIDDTSLYIEIYLYNLFMWFYCLTA